MQLLTREEIDMVHGGDRWCDTPEGRKPVAKSGESWLDCVQRESGYPGVSETSAMWGCGAQRFYDWIMEF